MSASITTAASGPTSIAGPPEVYAHQGAFYMFASFKHPSVCRGTAILRAESPLGPFRPHSAGCVTPKDWECLDGTLCISREGKPFMVFCHEWVQAGGGEVCAIALTDDLSAPAGGSQGCCSAPRMRRGAA